jgi:hypothetical protein
VQQIAECICPHVIYLHPAVLPIRRGLLHGTEQLGLEHL